MECVINRITVYLQRFPFFRIAYFVLWTCTFVIFQWIIHACVSMRYLFCFLVTPSLSLIVSDQHHNSSFIILPYVQQMALSFSRPVISVCSTMVCTCIFPNCSWVLLLYAHLFPILCLFIYPTKLRKERF